MGESEAVVRMKRVEGLDDGAEVIAQELGLDMLIVALCVVWLY